MERAIVSNIYDKKLISYCDVSDAELLEQQRIMTKFEKEQQEDDSQGFEVVPIKNASKSKGIDISILY